MPETFNKIRGPFLNILPSLEQDGCKSATLLDQPKVNYLKFTVCESVWMQVHGN